MSITLDPPMAIEILDLPQEQEEDTEEKYRERVADAAVVLDEHKPEWYERVNIDTLDMTSPYHCVLGQVFDERARWFRRKSSNGFSRGLDFLADRGIYMTHSFVSAADHEYWVAEIEARRAP